MANSEILGTPGMLPSAKAAKPAKPAKAAPAAKPAARSASVLNRIERDPRSWQHDLWLLLKVSTVSIVAHVVLFAVAWYTVMPDNIKEQILSVLVVQEPELSTEEEVKIEQVEMPEELEDVQETDTQPADVSAEEMADLSSDQTFDFSDSEEIAIPEIETTEGAFGGLTIASIRDTASGRSSAGQKVLVREHGGTEASQAAVNSGLRWLAEIQQSDGSWNFADIGKSADPGTLSQSQTGATGMALLCFLGAGHTHEKNDEGKFSPYKDNVSKGLSFLLRSAKLTPAGADLRGVVTSNEGMYVQGICATALCEAHALTKDKRLRAVAQAACQFIVNAQDPQGGGWRYQPRQAGDTSVVGWQVMALLSARHSKIPIPQPVFQGVDKFLNFVQADDGAQYGYDASQPGRPGTTSIGLLCRMYLGWKPDNKALRRGIEYICKVGPSPGDMYYNYYASQAVFMFANGYPKDSPEYALWTAWNNKLRDTLVATQATEGPERGSWKPVGGHGGDVGGRIFQTALSIMTLEVYYRKLPIYDRKKIQVDL